MIPESAVKYKRYPHGEVEIVSTELSGPVKMQIAQYGL